MPLFDRYRNIVDDYQAFCDVLSQPLPVSLWANPERISPKSLKERLAETGCNPVEIEWLPNSFRLPENERVGKRWEFFAGLYQIQEEAAMAPACVLAPKPGEIVLDMCAAPGNKTAQMAFMMRQQGTIIANDINSKRLSALRQTGDRLGIRNVTYCNFNAGNIPASAGGFDKILVDAPCSCEGTTRKNLNVKCESEESFSQKQCQAQTALLFKAAQLCRPGGYILYATCTYAPEENEEVVDSVLRKYGEDNLALCPISLPGLAVSAGITEWEGKTFSAQLDKAGRIWPHHNNTGGFFMCLIKKVQNRKAVTEKEVSEVQFEDGVDRAAGQKYRHEGIREVEERYQLSSESLDSLTYYQHGEQIYAVNKHHRMPALFTKGIHGIRLLHSKSAVAKLTHPGALLCGQEARRNYVVLNSDQLDRFLKREMVVLDEDNLKYCEDEGYVLVKHAQFSVGTGLLSSAASGHKILKSHFPKSWSRRLFSVSDEAL